jgi:hypothetical protein
MSRILINNNKAKGDDEETRVLKPRPRAYGVVEKSWSTSRLDAAPASFDRCAGSGHGSHWSTGAPLINQADIFILGEIRSTMQKNTEFLTVAGEHSRRLRSLHRFRIFTRYKDEAQGRSTRTKHKDEA